MATQTANLGLTLPSYEDAADIAVLSQNFEKIDVAAAQAAAAYRFTQVLLADLESRLGTLELKYGTNVTGNPFSVGFEALTGLEVAGVWNQPYARVEF